MAKDRKIDMVILGLLYHERLTGYDIKKRIDGGISYFWKGSFGSIYPSLSAMDKDGLVKKSEQDGFELSNEKQSGREKIYYEITDNGRETLREWLSDEKAVNDLKYETLLKLYFGGAVKDSISLATIERFENDIKKNLDILIMYRDNLAGILSERDHLFFYLTVLFGVETYEGYLRWCKEVKDILINNSNN